MAATMISGSMCFSRLIRSIVCESGLAIPASPLPQLAATRGAGLLPFPRLPALPNPEGAHGGGPRALQLHDELRLADPVEWQGQDPPVHLELNHSVRETRQPPFEEISRFDGLRKRNLCAPPRESLELGRLDELAVQARRTHLQNVRRTRDELLDVEDGPEFVAHPLAIPVAHPSGLVQDDPEKALAPHLPLDVQHVQPGGARHPFRRLANLFELHPVAGRGFTSTDTRLVAGLPANKKVGLRPLRCSTSPRNATIARHDEDCKRTSSLACQRHPPRAGRG